MFHALLPVTPCSRVHRNYTSRASTVVFSTACISRRRSFISPAQVIYPVCGRETKLRPSMATPLVRQVRWIAHTCRSLSSFAKRSPRSHLAVALPVLICFTSVALVAQVPTPPVSLLRLFVTATDQQGMRVANLTKDDFIVVDNDSRQGPALLENDVQPIAALIMIDTSASMTGTFEPLVAATDRFFLGFRPQDQMRAGTFSDKVQVTSRFTHDSAEVTTDLQTLDFGYGSRLHDALVASLDLLTNQPGLRVLIVVTDGTDTTSRTTRSQVLARERMGDVVVYAIGLHTRYFDGQRMVSNAPGRDLEQFAEETGGRYFDVPRTEDLPITFTRILDELHAHYVLGFSPQSKDGKVHKLSVQVKRPGITVRSRRSYVAEQSASR